MTELGEFPRGRLTKARRGREEALVDDAELYRAALDTIPEVSVFIFGHDLRYRFVGGGLFRNLGWRVEEVVGHRPSDILGPNVGALFEDHCRAALRGETRHMDVPGLRDASVLWANTIAPLCDASGDIIGGTVVSRDVAAIRQDQTAKQRLEDEAIASAVALDYERAQRERLQFLATLNEVIAPCVTRRDVMRSVSQAAVPRLGDWCTIYVFLDPDDPLPTVEVAHVDPAMVEYARGLQLRFPYDPGASSGVPEVVRTGRPAFYPEITGALLEQLQISPEAAEQVRHLGLHSSVIVPLEKGQRVIGAMQFMSASPGRRYTSDDLTLAQAAAGRVASALDNRRLAEAQTTIAQTLQRSLLPESLPRIPGAELAVRYWAAGEGAEVGGDFYDAFPIDGETFAIVIGDVCGHGPRAAAVTALARHTIRANAWRGDGPEEVLQRLNEAMLRTWPDTFCTVAYAMLGACENGMALTLAVGGHPLPLLVRGGGTALPLGRPGRLLGMLEGSHHPVSRIELEPSDTVMFYTDGANDLPPPRAMSDEETIELLAPGLSQARDADAAADFVFGVLDERVPFLERSDDTALVVLRVR